ncbi:MAG TPA: hypothetical protein VFQ53_06745 [Kofleriaceae bacterium]|nr:hypothetical protein [Kofleriaceae bacterium]
MKAALFAVLVMLGVVALAPREGATAGTASTIDPYTHSSSMQKMWDDDDDEEEWKCTCSVTCDGAKVSITERVCADDQDIRDAMDDAVAACYRDADARCDDEPLCKCSCKPTNNDC